jgi:hypothetical protein
MSTMGVSCKGGTLRNSKFLARTHRLPYRLWLTPGLKESPAMRAMKGGLLVRILISISTGKMQSYQR